MNDMRKYVLSIIVENRPNVMTRVSMLFARRCFNMQSVTAATTDDPAESVITIVTEGDERGLNQVVEQTRKLQDVKSVTVMSPSESLLRVMLVMRIEIDGEHLPSLRSVVDVYNARIIDMTSRSLVIEVTGKPSKIDGFLEVMYANYKILEMRRSGIIGLERNSTSWWTVASEEHH